MERKKPRVPRLMNIGGMKPEDTKNKRFNLKVSRNDANQSKRNSILAPFSCGFFLPVEKQNKKTGLNQNLFPAISDVDKSFLRIFGVEAPSKPFSVPRKRRCGEQ